MEFLKWGILFASLLVITGAYFKIALKFNILDTPNQRSSHNKLIVTGGGIIFPLAVILVVLINGQNITSDEWVFLAGLILLAFVSYWDDLKDLSSKFRLAVQLIAVLILGYSLNAGDWLPWPVLFLACGLAIAMINAYNFMDGINGMTGLYSLLTIITCAYLLQHTSWWQPGFRIDLLYIVICSCLIFLYLNFRKEAKSFAGDVGSVSLGFIVVYLIALIMIQTQDIKYIFLMAVYGIDAFVTIVQRILLRQNILQPHRMHLYQLLANEKQWDHRAVAGLFFFIQLVINILLVFTPLNWLQITLVVILPLVLIYVIVKNKLKKLI